MGVRVGPLLAMILAMPPGQGAGCVTPRGGPFAGNHQAPPHTHMFQPEGAVGKHLLLFMPPPPHTQQQFKVELQRLHLGHMLLDQHGLGEAFYYCATMNQKACRSVQQQAAVQADQAKCTLSCSQLVQVPHSNPALMEQHTQRSNLPTLTTGTVTRTCHPNANQMEGSTTVATSGQTPKHTHHTVKVCCCHCAFACQE